MIEHTIFQLTYILVLGIGAQWIAWRIRFPSILLLLLVGMMAGPVTGIINPDELFGDLLFPIISMSVGLILFEGGLSLRIKELPEVGGIVRNLVSIGAVISWSVTAFGAWWLLDLEAPLAILLGALLVVSGPTVISPLLRQIRPIGPVGTILKWEGILIDPIGALLTLLVFEAISGGEHSTSAYAVQSIFRTFAAGIGIGVGAGALVTVLLRRYWIPDFLQNPVDLGFVFAAFFLSNAIQPESGLLATTVMGIFLANQKWVDIEHIVEFKENLQVLLLSTLFVVLGARIELEYLVSIGPEVIGFLLILIFVARPVSVWFSSLFSNLSWKDRLFLSGMAPRGIVAAAISSIFAIRLEASGHEQAGLLVATTFTVIIVTVTLYGLAAPFLARKLGLSDPNPQGVIIVGAHGWARQIAEILMQKGYRVLVTDTNRNHTSPARMAGIPTYTGSILTEHIVDEIEIGGIGRLMAMTPNDWVNILAVQKFSRLFGNAEVYQLAATPSADEKKETHQHLYGRQLFGKEITFDILQRKYSQGAAVKATPLTEEFGFAEFQSQYGQDALPLFMIQESGELQPITVDQPLTPQPNQTLISLVKEPPALDSKSD